MSGQRRRPRASSGQGDLAAPGTPPLPPDLVAEIIEVGGETLVLFSFTGQREVPGALTDAEQAIAGLTLQGLTTAEIAAARGVATATVASQLQAIYRKLGVASRAELACKLS
ncbi:MAG TPA: helix-turn-helix transcriptional regulator [Gemmatimonadaceae bacterium]|nr:helix-turn-helix transcriptional regulator [Gemmatimonadaceae bacterium]